MLSGPRSLSRGLARVCPVDSRTGLISPSVGRAPNDQASPPHDSTASLRRGLIPGRDLELDRVIINEGQNNKADLACGHLGCYRRLGESAAPHRPLQIAHSPHAKFSTRRFYGSESNCVPQIWNNGLRLGNAVVSWCNTRPPLVSHVNGSKPLVHHGMAQSRTINVYWRTPCPPLSFVSR